MGPPTGARSPHALGPRLRTALLVLATVYLATLVLAAALLRLFADAWWPATVLAFAPRWPVALPFPFVVLVPLLLRRRRLLWALLPAALALLLLLDFRIPLPRPSPPAGSATIDVLTLNAGYRASPERLRRLLETGGIQVAAVQECELDLPSFAREGWQTRHEAGMCLLSRFPIRSTDALDPTAIRNRGGHGAAVRYLLDAPGGPLAVVSVHLQTVRGGLDEVLARGPAGGAALAANSAARDEESAAVRRFIDGMSSPGGTIVVGDLNMPVESAIYRRHWSNLGNAFSRAGFGLGWTKRTRWHGVRIDHVLHTANLRATRARLGEDVGSDHRPVLARLSR